MLKVKKRKRGGKEEGEEPCKLLGLVGKDEELLL